MRILTEQDIDIPRLASVYQLPEISKYLSISDNYFKYIANTPNVYFYKAYKNNDMVGAIHLEIEKTVMFLSILVFPEFQRSGYGTEIIRDVQNDVLNLNYETIEISVNEQNIASLNLFKKTGFTFASKEDELLNFVYKRG